MMFLTTYINITVYVIWIGCSTAYRVNHVYADNIYYFPLNIYLNYSDVIIPVYRTMEIYNDLDLQSNSYTHS